MQPCVRSSPLPFVTMHGTLLCLLLMEYCSNISVVWLPFFYFKLFKFKSSNGTLVQCGIFKLSQFKSKALHGIFLFLIQYKFKCIVQFIRILPNASDNLSSPPLCRESSCGLQILANDKLAQMLCS